LKRALAFLILAAFVPSAAFVLNKGLMRAAAIFAWSAIALAACSEAPIAASFEDAAALVAPDAAAFLDAGPAGLDDAAAPLGDEDAAVSASPDVSPDAATSSPGDATALGDDAAALLDAAANASPDGSLLVPDAGSAATYRNSLSVCWTDATCNRAMVVAHGGDWSAAIPYNSRGALVEAFNDGVDGVKIDVRVTRDDVPVIAHSSPIAIHESLDCYNQRIEDMTAAEVAACHLLPSRTETFQRLDDALNYLRGKMVVQLTVKESRDYQRAIAEVVALGAEDFAFFEISTDELQNQIPTIPLSGQVWYLIDVADRLTEIDTLLNVINNPRAFMYEMEPDPSIGMIVSTRLHPAGIRSFTYDSAAAASVRSFEGLFNDGFDVVSANATGNNLQARMRVNMARGIAPP